MSIGLLILLAAGFMLRFWKLKERGIIFWDDGCRLNEVLFVTDMADFLKRNWRAVLAKGADFTQAARQFRGQRLTDCNPLATFFFYLTSRLLKGVDQSGLAANAFFGVLGIWGIYWAGSALFDPVIGLLAAFLLTISGYHLLYSRSVHKEVISGTFYVWATYVYYQSWYYQSVPLLLVAGLLIGASYLCNYRQIHLPFLFICYEIGVWLPVDQSFGWLLTRLVVLGVGMAAPLLAMEEIFIVLKELGYPYPSYFKQLYHISNNSAKINWRFPYLKMFADVFYELEGMIWPLLALAGLIILGREHDLAGMIVLTQAIVPILFWSARPTEQLVPGNWNFATPRLVSSAIYALALAGAIALAELPGPAVLGALVCLMIVSLIRFRKIFRIRSGYPKALEFILSRGNGKHISSCPPVSAYFAGQERVASLAQADTIEKIKELHRQGYSHLLYVKHLYQYRIGQTSVPPLDQWLAGQEPVLAVEHGLKELRTMCRDEYNNPAPANFSDFGHLAVYSLDSLVPGIGHPKGNIKASEQTSA